MHRRYGNPGRVDLTGWKPSAPPSRAWVPVACCFFGFLVAAGAAMLVAALLYVPLHAALAPLMGGR